MEGEGCIVFVKLNAKQAEITTNNIPVLLLKLIAVASVVSAPDPLWRYFCMRGW